MLTTGKTSEALPLPAGIWMQVAPRFTPSTTWRNLGTYAYGNVAGLPGSKVTWRLVRSRIDPATGLPDDTAWHDLIIPSDGVLRFPPAWAGANPGGFLQWEIRAAEPATLGTRFAKWWRLP